MTCPHCHPQRPPATAPISTPTSASATAQPKKSFFRRGVRKTTWIVPGITLILMPKCPICLAAYIALTTGISVPIAAATWLRGALIVLCAASLAWLIIRWSLYLYRRAIH